MIENITSYFPSAEVFSNYLGVSVTTIIVILVIITIWDTIWKLIALWKASRNNSITWFIILFLVNSVGILPIVYIYFFSKKKEKAKTKKRR